MTAAEARSGPLLQLAVIGGLSSFGPLSLDLYLPALPRIAHTLHASDAVVQLSVSACLVGLAAGQFVAGPLGDRFGRRRPLLAGVAMWTLAALVCAFAPTAPAFVALRFIQGLGGAAGLVLGRAVIRDLYESERLARMFTIVALLSNIAPAVAPVSGGVLLTVMSWRGLFIVLAGVGAVLLLATWRLLPESLPPERRQAGGLAATAAVARRLVRDRLFLGASTAYALASAMLFTYISLSSVVLQRRYGLDATTFSLVFAGNSLGIIAVGWLTVRLLRSRGSEAVLAAGLGAALLACLVLCVTVLAGWGVAAVLVPLLCAISTIGLVLPIATGLALLRHRDAAGAGSALLGGAQYLAGGVAGPIVSAIADTASGMAVGMAIAAAGALIAYRLTPRAPVTASAGTSR